jgi:hypothetical protein
MEAPLMDWRRTSSYSRRAAQQQESKHIMHCWLVQHAETVDDEDGSEGVPVTFAMLNLLSSVEIDPTDDEEAHAKKCAQRKEYRRLTDLYKQWCEERDDVDVEVERPFNIFAAGWDVLRRSPMRVAWVFCMFLAVVAIGDILGAIFGLFR